MSKAKMEAARELIKEKKYAEARAILRTVDHPTAAEWVARIDTINPPKKSAVPTLLLGILGALVILLILAGIVYSQRDRIPAVAALFATATPTNTPTPTASFTPTPTFTPTATDTPIVTSTPTQPTDTPAPDMGKWEISNKTSELSNTKQFTLFLQSENKVHGSILDEYSTLILRCRNTGTEVYLSTDMIVQYDFDNDKSTVQLKVDSGAVETISADTSTDHEALFLSNPLDRIRILKRAKRMIVGFSPLDRTQVEVSFNLQGLQQAIDSSGADAEGCGW